MLGLLNGLPKLTCCQFGRCRDSWWERHSTSPGCCAGPSRNVCRRRHSKYSNQCSALESKLTVWCCCSARAALRRQPGRDKHDDGATPVGTLGYVKEERLWGEEVSLRLCFSQCFFTDGLKITFLRACSHYLISSLKKNSTSTQKTANQLMKKNNNNKTKSLRQYVGWMPTVLLCIV